MTPYVVAERILTRVTPPQTLGIGVQTPIRPHRITIRSHGVVRSPIRGTLVRTGVLEENALDHILEPLAPGSRDASGPSSELCVHLDLSHALESTLGVHTPGERGCHDGIVPNKPKTPHRTFRISDDVYLPALAKAREEGISLSEVVRDALIEYVDDEER